MYFFQIPSCSCTHHLCITKQGVVLIINDSFQRRETDTNVSQAIVRVPPRAERPTQPRHTHRPSYFLPILPCDSREHSIDFLHVAFHCAHPLALSGSVEAAGRTRSSSATR